MKRSNRHYKLAVLAALPAAVLLANTATAAVDIYGKLNVSLQQNTVDQNSGANLATDGDIKHNYTLDSNASRIGFKTATDLGDTGLKGVAKLEFGTSVSDGDGPLTSRNSYIGVQGGFGTVIAGKFDTPMKESQGKADLFNDYILGDIVHVLLVGEDRAPNIVMYSTPKMNSGIAANFAFIPGEDNAPAGSTNQNNGIASYYSASVTYDKDNMYFALAHNNAMAASSATNSGAKVTRATAQLKFDAFTVGAIIQNAKSADDVPGSSVVNSIAAYGGAADKAIEPYATSQPATNWSTFIHQVDGYILNSSYTMGSNVFKLQYGSSTSKTGTTALSTTAVNQGDLKIKLWDLGYDYHLSKDAMVYSYYGNYKGTQNTPAGVDRKVDAKTLAVGYELKF